MNEIDIAELRRLLSEASGGEWIAGHMTNPDHSCKCRYILSSEYMGSIAEISERVDEPIGEGGNDSPPEQEAIANAKLIVAMRNALPALLDLAEARQPSGEEVERHRSSLMGLHNELQANHGHVEKSYIVCAGLRDTIAMLRRLSAHDEGRRRAIALLRTIGPKTASPASVIGDALALLDGKEGTT